MENEVTEVKQQMALPALTPQEIKETAISWLTNTGNLKKFSENEKNQFIDMCLAYQLNPIKREIYGIKYGENFNIIVGYEVYLKRAERSGLLDGFSTTTRQEGNDTIATCTIYRKDWKNPFVHEVYLSEYDQHNKMWKEKPKTMIKKVAEAQAFRKAFPDELGGMPYTADELPAADEMESAPAPKMQQTKPKAEEKKYTAKEAAEIGKIVKTKDSAGKEMFTKKEINNVKLALVKEGFTSAKELAESIMNAHMDAAIAAEAAEDEKGDIY